MAKDAKGHGSEKRGGGGGDSLQDVALGHQLNIARSTVKMPAAMAGVMGGMTQDQAHALIQQHGSAADKAMARDYDPMGAARANLTAARSNPLQPFGAGMSGRDLVSDTDAAKALAGGGAKSAPVDVHPAMGHGPFPSNADFVAKYGGPRDHAAEQRGFNSGMREINRLKRQGK